MSVTSWKLRAFCAAMLVTCLPLVGQAADTDPGLKQRMLEQRAIEAVIWGMPAVNFQRMKQAMLDAKGAPNQVVYWSRPVNWKDQTLTPNPGTIYFNPFYDVSNGPVVLDIPAIDGERSISGSVDDAWQNALEDVGIAGVDKGRGGRYVILPPDYSGEAPQGYIPLASDTFNGFAILRSNLNSGSEADIAAAVAYGKRIRMYPLADAGGNPQTTFVDVYDVMFDATIPYDHRFFTFLNAFVQAEPWLTRDKVMIDILRSVGIEKGQPFNPDAKTRTILGRAAEQAHAVIDANYEALLDSARFNRDARWALPATTSLMEGLPTFFADPDSYPVDARAITYSIAYFSAKRLGAGQFYLMAIKDRAGRPLDGRSTYRLTIPANVPVKLYWLATAYDRETHTLIRNAPHSSRGSISPGLQTNADGSVDLWFAPSAPTGRESNWVPTTTGFEVLFRFYGPQERLFNKTWVLPDIETVE